LHVLHQTISKITAESGKLMAHKIIANCIIFKPNCLITSCQH